MDQYQILGQQIAEALRQQDQAANLELVADALATGKSDILGAFGGLDFVKSLLPAVTEGVSKGIDYKQQQDADAASKAASAAAVAKAIAADINWANAEQQLELVQQAKIPNPTAISAAQSLQSAAMAASLSAGSGLSADAQAKRAQAAQDASNKASQASLAAPGDSAKAALMHGWAKVIAGMAASSPAASTALDKAKKGSKHGSESWWISPQIWGVPGWGVVVGGTGIATGLVLLLKHLFGRRK